MWVEEFGEACWINLIAEPNDGRFIFIGEYEWGPWDAEKSESLIAAELTQREYSLSDVEGQTIAALQNVRGEFAVVLDNGLAVHCLGGPGGNQPWIYQ